MPALPAWATKFALLLFAIVKRVVSSLGLAIGVAVGRRLRVEAQPRLAAFYGSHFLIATKMTREKPLLA